MHGVCSFAARPRPQTLSPRDFRAVRRWYTVGASPPQAIREAGAQSTTMRRLRYSAPS